MFQFGGALSLVWGAKPPVTTGLSFKYWINSPFSPQLVTFQESAIIHERRKCWIAL